MRCKNLSLLPLLLPFIIIGSIRGQELNYKIDELLTIGGSEFTEDYQLYSPQEIYTDSQGNIYLRDIMSPRVVVSAQILKFTPQGVFEREFGQGGQGPGEFMRVLCFCVDDQDQIIMSDEDNSKWSFFKSDGTLIKEIRKKRGLNLYLLEMYPLQGNMIFMHSESNEYSDRSLFSIYAPDFETEYESFGRTADFFDLSDPFLKRHSQYHKVYHAFLDSTKLLGCHEYYTGSLTLLSKTDSVWQASEVRAFKPRYSAFKKMPDNYRIYENGKIKIKGKKIKFGSLMMYGERGKLFSYQINNRTVGLYPFQNNKYIQFIVHVNKKKKYEFGFNLFSDKGEFEGYQKISINNGKSRYSSNVIGQADADEFFLSERVDDYPIIRKIKIHQ